MIFKLFNIFFRIFLIFLICFVWMRYFVRELWLSVLYTALLTISIELILHFLFMRKNQKNNLKTEEENLSEKISATFIFSPKSALNYFFNLCKINHSAKKMGKYIIISPRIAENADTNSDLQENKNITILYPLYSYSPIVPQNLVDIIKQVEKNKPQKLIICGYKIDMATYKLASKIKEFKIILLNSNDCFIKLIKNYNYYPENLKELNLKEKLTFKDILRQSVSRKRSKGYFIASLFLLFSSFIVRLNIYYVIMSSLLLLLSLLSFFLPSNRLKNEENIL